MIYEGSGVINRMATCWLGSYESVFVLSRGNIKYSGYNTPAGGPGVTKVATVGHALPFRYFFLFFVAGRLKKRFSGTTK